MDIYSAEIITEAQDLLTQWDSEHGGEVSCWVWQLSVSWNSSESTREVTHLHKFTIQYIHIKRTKEACQNFSAPFLRSRIFSSIHTNGKLRLVFSVSIHFQWWIFAVFTTARTEEHVEVACGQNYFLLLYNIFLLLHGTPHPPWWRGLCST